MSLPHSVAPRPAVLVVDDVSENLDILKRVLRDDYVVLAAISGELALRIAQQEPRPDLILLDIMMPEMDGYEVMRRLREDPLTADIPVIFVTAMADFEGELRGLQLGAVDYIVKPYNTAIVRARVRTHLALREARRRIQQQNNDLRYDRELVERIIVRMRESLSFDGRYLRLLESPAERVNGDIVLSAFTPDGRQWIAVGDITGHGLPAAVAAPLLSHVFYEGAARGADFASVLLELNAVMYRQLPAEIFMVGCFLEVSADRREVSAWNAAMPPALLMREGKRLSALAPLYLPPLGITLDLDVGTACEQLRPPPGSVLYILSDGITEAQDTAGEEFGEARAEAFLGELQSSGLPLTALLTQLQDFHGSAEFKDDITLVEVAF